ncbi:MAG: 1-aminocyclopropane-1-carboxylate deaminase [Cytophagaceae bacterium]|nr:1-aminocyclopropane-1-carboxylate deaminase [Cytophagaceae bacterium]|tara:strand:- start:2517 stop:3470 length:954 start_codon:yes stop_codon:yes gene_type:complete
MNLQEKNTVENILIQDINGIGLYLKREDLLHPQVSGNKFRKLKYNLAFAKKTNKQTLLTYGGAFSNHIAATAAAASLQGLRSIGIIRGDELAKKINTVLEENTTLQTAYENGMKLIFVNRGQYRKKDNIPFTEFLKHDSFAKKDFRVDPSDVYIIPEGGTNALAVRGCEEILQEGDTGFDYICCPVGTGGTISGIINASAHKQKILGFPALKGDFLTAEIKKYARKDNWQLITDYTFGGYGKINTQLVDFINTFKKEHKIALDPVYTSKMLYGICDMVNNGYFRAGANILAIHTGGLQGIAGFNSLLSKKGLQTIDT